MKQIPGAKRWVQQMVSREQGTTMDNDSGIMLDDIWIHAFILFIMVYEM